MRNWHYLHASRAVGWPQQSIALSVVTTEPDPEDEHSRRFRPTLLGWAAVAWTGDRGQAEDVWRADGITARCFWQWLETRLKRGRSTWIWQLGACHGLTYLGFWEMLTYKQWVLCGCDTESERSGAAANGGRGSGLCVVSDPPTLLLARPANQRGACQWVDLRNLSPRARYGGPAGICKGNDPGADGVGDLRSGRLVARDRAVSLAHWLQTWYDTVRSLNLGGLRATAAAQAWHGWRTNYMSCPVEVHTDDARLRAERDAIYGGRCECYRVRQDCAPVCHLDAPGYYPALGATHPLPGRIARCSGHATDGAWAAARDGYLVIARGRVEPIEPVLPYRRDGITIYPVGSWRATYCWPEWELLQRAGGRAEIERWWGYEACYPFQKFFGTLRTARAAARSVGAGGVESAIKLLANSLIGRCAAVSRYWQNVPGASHHRPWDEWPVVGEDGRTIERWRAIGWRVQRQVEDGYHPEAVPAIAAWTYSLGRVQLWEWMEVAGAEEIYYCDTDSLWTGRAGRDRLVSAGALEDRQLVRLREVAAFPWARFHGHKHYESPGGAVCAGAPRPPVGYAGNGWRQWRGQSPAEAARARQAPAPELIAHDLTDRTPYRGGRVGADGRVFPWEVYDSE